MFKILFTGGGTAGHVIPNIALCQYIQSMQAVSMIYVGSKQGIEKQFIEAIKIAYYPITTGKLRRYLTWRNLLMPFQLCIGIFQAFLICRRFKPTIVFSKGGFVALPVVIAAWLSKVPIVVHESDLIPGLANRLSFPLASLICTAFEQLPQKRYAYKTQVTGLPVRQALLTGNSLKGRAFLGFHKHKPILLIWGGSLGAASLNNSIARLLPKLILHFQIVHLCGPNKKIESKQKFSEYRAFEYLNVDVLAHVLACADLVVSRAGATAIYELLLLNKPNILCPLSTTVSRGEQIYNANYCAALGLSKVITPESLNDMHLMTTIKSCLSELSQMQAALQMFSVSDGAPVIYKALLRIIN